MAAREIRAGRAFVELTLRSKIESGLRDVSRKLRTFGAGLAGVGRQLATVGAAGTAGLLGLVTIFARMGDSLDKMSARTGVSVEALSELGFAAEQSGADLQTVEQVVRRMQRSLVDAERGGNEASQAMASLGLSTRQMLKLKPDEQLESFADALSKVENPTRRSALAQIALGKSSAKLLPLLSQGSEGIAELRQQARDLGLTVSTADASLGATLTDTLNKLYRSAKQVAFVIGAALAPLIIDLADRFVHLVVATRNWIDDNRALIVAVFKLAVGLTAAGVALITIGALFSSVGSVLGVIASVIGLAAGAFVAIKGAVLLLISPIGLAVAAIAAIGAALVHVVGVGDTAIKFLMQQFKSLRDEVVESFQGIADAIVGGDLALAAKIAWLSVKLAVERGMGAIYTLYANFKSRLAKAGVEVFYGAAQIAVDAYAAMQRGITNAFANIRSMHVKLGAFMGEWWARRTDEAIASQVEQMKQAGRAAAEREAAMRREEAIARGATEGSDELFQIDLEREQAIARSQVAADEFQRREQEIRNTGADVAGQLSADLQQIVKDRDAALADIKSGVANSTKYLEDSLKQALANIASDLKKQTGSTADAIAKAREEWEAAIEQARQQRAARDEATAARARFQAPNFDLGDPTQQSDRARGAFESAAALLLGSDSSVAGRTARAAETTARQTTESTRLLRDIQRQQTGGLAFS